MERDEIRRFGKWVKEQRKLRKMTQLGLAAALNLAGGTISAIEQGTIAAIGPKMKETIEAYFRGDCLKVEKTVNTDLVERLAEVVAAPDFKDKVDVMCKTLGCTPREAIVMMFEMERRKLTT